MDSNTQAFVIIGTEGNVLAVHNGFAYVANGGYCSIFSQSPTVPSLCASAKNGEIDIYDVSSLTGYHINDIAPIKVIAGPGINFPASVIVAPRGTGLGTMGIRRMTVRHGRVRLPRAQLRRPHAF